MATYEDKNKIFRESALKSGLIKDSPLHESTYYINKIRDMSLPISIILFVLAIIIIAFGEVEKYKYFIIVLSVNLLLYGVLKTLFARLMRKDNTNIAESRRSEIVMNLVKLGIVSFSLLSGYFVYAVTQLVLKRSEFGNCDSILYLVSHSLLFLLSGSILTRFLMVYFTTRKGS